MSKQEISNFNTKQAFDHGQEMKALGKSLSFNPYRNTDLNDSELFSSWVSGWNSK